MAKAKQTFPPAPEKSWEDGEDSLPRVWALLAQPERSDSGFKGDYVTLKFSLVSVVDTYDDDRKKIRNPGSSHAMDDLQVYSQGDQYEPDRLYGYGLRYHQVYAADAYKLGKMHAFLSTFEKKMARLKEQYGDAPDFAHYMVRLAQVLNVRYLIEKRKDDPSGWESYDRGDYRFTCLFDRGRFNGQSLLWRLQGLIRKLWSETDRETAAAKAKDKGTGGFFDGDSTD